MVGLAVLLGGFVVGIVVSIPLYLLDAPDALLVLAAGLGVYAPGRLVLLVGEPP